MGRVVVSLAKFCDVVCHPDEGRISINSQRSAEKAQRFAKMQQSPYSPLLEGCP